MNGQPWLCVAAVTAMVCTGLIPSQAWAEVKKTLHFESTPSGAEVFVKEGTREVSLGKTPLDYEAEFHSEMSVLRFTFKKRLYKPFTVEVSAREDRVSPKLVPLAIGQDPLKIADPEARALQERLNPLLDRILPPLLSKSAPFEFELAEPVTVDRTKNEKTVLLAVPIQLGRSNLKLEGTGEARYAAFARSLWQHFGNELALPLAKALQSEKDLNEILLAVYFDEQRNLFGVESHVETRVEMECVAGHDQVWEFDSCAYYVNGNCRSGNKLKSKYNPCQFRRPVTKSELKISPQAGATRIQAQAGFFLPLNLSQQTTDADTLFEKIDVLVTDAKGKQLFGRLKPAK
jgi:hypothetical protein